MPPAGGRADLPGSPILLVACRLVRGGDLPRTDWERSGGSSGIGVVWEGGKQAGSLHVCRQGREWQGGS